MEYIQKRWRYMAAAMILALCSGIGYAWSVFQKPLMENFDWALKIISITFTIQVMISTIAPVFLSRLLKKLGTKKYLRIGIVIYVIGILATGLTKTIGYLYLIYGVVVGIGIAVLYPTLMAYATGLFPDKPGMASGLLAGAYGSGAILWAPIAAFLMGKYGTMAVFGLLAGIFAVIMIPVSFIIKNVPEDYQVILKNDTYLKKATVTSIDYNWKQMLKKPTYYILLVTLTLGASAGLMIAGHASGMLQEILEFNPAKAAVFVGLFSVFNTAGRLLFGFISDKLGRNNVMIILFTIICTAMFLMSKNEGSIFVVSLLFVSACYGGFTAMFSPVCADNFGMKNLSVNYAFLYIAYGLAGFVGPQIAAKVKDVSGGYRGAFIAVAIMCIAGIMLVFLLRRRQQVESRKVS